MKIAIRQIPQEGLSLRENLDPNVLHLDFKEVIFSQPIEVKAQAARITNVVTVDIELSGKFDVSCSRCLDNVGMDLSRKLKFNYTVTNLEEVINLDEDIRQELILNAPVKPLCSDSCKGLCSVCGKNLNQGGCSCGTT